MLEVKNLTKIYKSKGDVITKALDDVSIKFPDTGMVFLLGKSGSGKSTLLNVSGGLDTPTNGEIIVKGRSSSTFSGSDFDSYRNTYIGFIFQEYNILNEFTVEDNIALALELQGKSKDKEKINNLLKQVELENFAKRKPNTLSGGQKQRIAIARALIKDPEIIMADEPTGALDSNTGKQVLDTLKNLSKTKLVIVVSHDKEFAEIYGDRIIELKDGKILSDVSKEQLEAKKIGNITMIDNNTISIKSGTELTSEDLKELNSFLKNSTSEVLISNSEKEIKDYKNQARISDNGSKESFVDTNEEKYELKQYSEEDSKLIHSKLPLKHAVKIGTSNLKLKPFRLMLTILLSVVAFVLLGVVSTMMFYDKTEVAATSFANSDIEYIPVNKSFNAVVSNEYYDYSYNNNYSVNMSNADKEKLELKYGDNSIFYYDFGTQSSLQNINDSYLSIDNCYRSNKNNFYSSSIIGFSTIKNTHPLYDKIIDGNYPTKDNEIMISSFTFDSIKNIGMVDKNNENYSINSYKDIKYLTINGNEFTVSGIYDVDYLIPDKYKDLATDNTNHNLQYQWSTELNYGIYSLVLVNDNFYEANRKDFQKEKYSFSYISSPIKMNYSENEIYTLGNAKDFELINFDGSIGSNPKDNEIYISSYQLLNYIQQYLNTDKTINLDYINKNLTYTVSEISINSYDSRLISLAVKDNYELRNQTGKIIKSTDNNDIYISSLALNLLISEIVASNISLEEKFYSYDSLDLSYSDMLQIFTYGYLGYATYTIEQRIEYWNTLNEFLKENNINLFGQSNIAQQNSTYSYNIAGFVFDNNNPILYCDEDTFKKLYVTEMDHYSSPWKYEFYIDYFDELYALSNYNDKINIDGEEVEFTEELKLAYWKKIYDFLNGYDLIDDIFSNRLEQSNSGTTDVNIVGFVFLKNEVIIANEALFSKLYYTDYPEDKIETNYIIDKEAIITGAFIYNSDKENIKSLLTEIYTINDDDDSILSINCSIMNTLDMVNSFVEGATKIFLWIGIVIAAFATLLLFNFISMSIINKKKEIGILRAVGARGLDVFKIFFSESIAIVTICFIIAIIGNIFVCNIINTELGEGLSGVKLFVFGPQSILLIFGISLLVSFVSTFLPVYTIAKKKPVDSIRSI